MYISLCLLFQLKATDYKKDLKSLSCNMSFILSTFGFTCVSFCTGALAWCQCYNTFTLVNYEASSVVVNNDSRLVVVNKEAGSVVASSKGSSEVVNNDASSVVVITEAVFVVVSSKGSFRVQFFIVQSFKTNFVV